MRDLGLGWGLIRGSYVVPGRIDVCYVFLARAHNTTREAGAK